MTIHEKITALRTERGWTLSRLAKEACIPLTTVYNWFNENHFTPSRDKIEDICAAFKISVAEFYADLESEGMSAQEVRLLEKFRKLSRSNKYKMMVILDLFDE